MSGNASSAERNDGSKDWQSGVCTHMRKHISLM